jgi:Ricin-type beta-trefoil lectin domain-like
MRDRVIRAARCLSVLAAIAVPMLASQAASAISTSGAPTTKSGSPSTTKSGAPSTTKSGAPSGTKSGAPSGTKSGAPSGTKSGAPSSTTSGAVRYTITESWAQGKMCLDVYNGPTGRGTRDLQPGDQVDQWKCFPGHTNQEWVFDFAGFVSIQNGSYPSFQVKSVNSTMCLDDIDHGGRHPDNGLGAGNHVQQWTCLYSDGRPAPNQVWIIIPHANGSELVNDLSLKALEINGNESPRRDPTNHDNGDIADQWPFWDGPNQVWSFRAA